ncbi:MAG: hypothetical protein R6U96_13795 [Promethearchaeia archaeon]
MLLYSELGGFWEKMAERCENAGIPNSFQISDKDCSHFILFEFSKQMRKNIVKIITEFSLAF